MLCRYGDGTARATVEGNILFPFIPEDKIEDLQVSCLQDLKEGHSFEPPKTLQPNCGFFLQDYS